jgi:hypothetical protein
MTAVTLLYALASSNLELLARHCANRLPIQANNNSKDEIKIQFGEYYSLAVNLFQLRFIEV